LSKQTIINNGSSESEVIAFAVIPVGPFSENAVTTQTPVAKCPIASLKRRLSASSVTAGGIQYDPRRDLIIGATDVPVFGRVICPAVKFNRSSRALLIAAFVVASVVVAGCGSQGVSVPQSQPVAYQGAQIFAERCGGCHTISAAGTQGSKPKGETNSRDRTNGPNFNSRKETYDSAITAIRQGGFSGAIMPGNIVTGKDADAVAVFLAKYSGKDAVSAQAPGSDSPSNATGAQ
jgi:mono/diheme cytochrome c family protein